MDLTDVFNYPLHAGLTKTLRIMRLTAIFIIAACLQSQAKGFSQTVTLSEKNAPLEKVLKDIKHQTGFNFLYDVDLLQQALPVDLEVRNASLETVLAQCFTNQPFSYTIAGKVIVLSRKEPGKAEQLSVPPPTDIQGRVTDSSGAALTGASVTVKGTKKGTTTDAKGNFELRNVDENATIIISYSGFEAREFRLSNNPALKSGGLSVVLQHSSSSLDQVQIIAYGTTTQRLSTGDVTTVSGDDIAKQPVDNPLLALDGRVPGLFITQATGFPGSGVTVLIQGQNSIQNGNDPFYVIDGVPYPSQLLPNFGGVLGNSGANNANTGNPLSFIDPSSIESISVLKDAAATAIYGSRAANGAILITTKKGRAGKTLGDLDFQSGIGQVAHTMKLLNTSQYLEMRHEAISNDGLTTGFGDYDINGTWDTTRYTDWQKTLIGRSAQYLNMHASVSGGTELSQYLVGGTFHRETTVFPGDFADQKGSVNFNLNSFSVNKKFRLQLSANYSFDDSHLPSYDITNFAVSLPPDAPPMYKPDGSINWVPDPNGNSTFNPQPVAYLSQPYWDRTNNLVSNLVLGYLILPGLEIRSNFGYSNMQSNEIVTQPLIATAPELQAVTERSAQYGTNSINSWIIEPQLNYKKTIGAGRLEALIGTSIQQSNSNSQQLAGAGYNSDLVLQDILSAATVNVISTVDATYKYNAAFARIDYDWESKYIIDLTARRDGSSRFGANNRFHDFEAAGIGWIFSQEQFIRHQVSWLSFGKLRASFGTTGNDQIGNYKYLDLYYPPFGVGVPYQGATGLLPNNLPNPYLEWEETKKWEGGIDLGVSKDRVLVNATYFQNRSSNQLLGYALPIITGFGSITKNLPATVQNSGWEFTVNTVNVKAKKFSWTTNINITIPRNRLISFPDLAASSYAYFYAVGQPITATRVYLYRGVDPQTGIYQFADTTGKATSNPAFALSNTTLVNTAPEWYGSIQNNFQYKGFDLDFLFQYTRQRGQGFFFGNGPGSYSINQPIQVLNRWRKPGDVATHQMFNSDYSLYLQYNDAVSSDAGLPDASYLRFKNLSLSWQLPGMMMKRLSLQNVRIYMQGENLFTLTHFVGLDPASKSFNTLPALRVLTAGIKVGL